MNQAFFNDYFSDQKDMLFNRMIDEIRDYAIILLDPSGNIVHWNKGASFVKGYEDHEVLGKHFRMFYSAEDQQKRVPEKLLEEAAASGRAVYEGWRIRKDGSLFWGSIVLTALHDDDGKVIGYSKLTRNLTELKNAFDALETKNSELEGMNKELASFAYVASHDLQEPLRKIQTFLSRIAEQEKGKLSEKSEDFFKRIMSASARMQALIDDLLAYSRTSTDQRKFEKVDLNELIAEVKADLNETIHEKNAEIRVATMPPIDAVRFQIKQLFVNLLSNSLKFSKQDVPPVITISSESVKGRAILQRGIDSQKDYLHITVADNGIGFEPEYNQKVFDIFQRLHGRSEYSGTGIGLAICKKIVENHSGVIFADGQKDKGAAFHMFLPS